MLTPRILMIGLLGMSSLACHTQRHDVGRPVWVSSGSPSAPADDEGVRPSGALMALRYWDAQRSHPARQMPKDGFGRAVQQSREMRDRFAGGGLDDGLPPWISMGPNNVGGRTLCLALSPDDPDVIYAGSASGGLWRSVTGGVGAAAWDRIDLGFPALAVSSIAIDPTDSDLIYVGTGESYRYQLSDGGEVDRTTRGSYGVGILKSIDGGLSWSQSLDWSLDQSRGVWMIQIAPDDPDLLYAATTEGVYRSIDAGDNWSLVHNVILATDVRIHPLDSQTVFAAHGNFGSTDHGIYRTIDGGQNWVRLENGLPVGWTGKAQLSLSSAAPVLIFASISNALIGEGLFRSTDNGDSWVLVNDTNYPSFQGWYAHYVLLSPHSNTRLMVGGVELWRSSDGGTTLEPRSNWQAVFFDQTSPPEGPIGGPQYAHSDHHFAVWHPTDPDTILFASDGGIFKTTDFGQTFQSLIGGYQTSQFYNGLGLSATDPGRIIGGLQDNFTVIREQSNSWRRVIGGDGSWSAIDPSDDEMMYATRQTLRNFMSQNGGDSWTPIFPPEAGDDVTAFIAPQVLAASQPARLYAGRSIVYRSDDRGSNWIATNGGLPLSSGDPVVAMAVADSDPDQVLVATAPLAGRARLFRTEDAGDSWLEVTGFLPDRYPSDVVIDPHDPQHALVTLMGFGAGHVFETRNGGASWNGIDQGLPDIPASAAAFDPDFPEALYVGTDLGIFVTLNFGQTWQPFDNGIPEAMINDLKVFGPTRRLRAATHGNGVWERELLGPGNCDVPGQVTQFQVNLGAGGVQLSWAPPFDLGPAALRYDVLASPSASSFIARADAICLEAGGGLNLSATDSSTLQSGQVRYYLVRAVSLCGSGSSGADSNGVARASLTCDALRAKAL